MPNTLAIICRYSLVLLCCGLTACGFHLRGQAQLPAGVEPLYISGVGGDHPLAVELRSMLTASGVELAASADVARYRLHILKLDRDTRTATVGAGARTAEYRLFESVEYELRDPGGRRIIGPTKLVEQRILYNNPNQVVSTGSEETLLRREMQQHLADKIARQLQAFDYSSVPAQTPADETAP